MQPSNSASAEEEKSSESPGVGSTNTGETPHSQKQIDESLVLKEQVDALQLKAAELERKLERKKAQVFETH